MTKILVTDSLFIDDDDVAELAQNGIQVERLDKPDASEDEIIEALRGKQGYILGGIEKVTERVVQSTQGLEWIIFTGTDYKEFIPGWQLAEQKGIKLANVPGASADAVAEWAVAAALMMQRNLLELGRTGKASFQTVTSVKDSTIGIVGMGHVGQAILRDVQGFSPRRILYANRSEKDCTAEKVDLETLMSESDIMFVALPKSAGCVVDKTILGQCKNGALMVSISPRQVVDMESLLPLVQQGKLRGAFDGGAPTSVYAELPLSCWYNSNSIAAYNTSQANKLASTLTVETAINLTKTGEDVRRVV